jgi:DNA invertase Pin-like site-specific DNA recombinase
MKRVALYVRCSTMHQETEMQKRECLPFIEARGWTLHKIYSDEGYSGTSKKRPALNELIKATQNREVDVVLCWKLDRFFRSLSHLTQTLQEFTELGIDFVSLRDNIDLTTSSGRLMLNILASFAEFEASLIRERVRAGIANARAKGIKLGRPKKRNDLQIQVLRNQGLTIRQVAEQLGITTGSVQRALEVKK